ncbi:MAG: LCP family protein [Romboutsia sp.]|nr:LCP family protein [Romboutsia sp.]
MNMNENVSSDAIISDNITNILLIGTDARNTSERGRSDAMIIATIDEKHQSIKLTSLARDTYVEIPGYDKQKLNHAYSYGGTKLLINTIEHNFSIDISNYAIVDFSSFSSIIDSLGGVDIEIRESEIEELNKYIPECFEYNTNKKHKNIELIKKPGLQTLNGYQALSYSRIRKNDSSIQRDNRQRKVIQAIMDEVSDISVLEIPKLINSVLPYVKTDMDFSRILNIGKKILKMGNFNLEQLTFPMQEYSKNSKIAKKGDVIEFEKDKCLPLLHKFIFEDEDLLTRNEIYNSYK